MGQAYFIVNAMMKRTIRLVKIMTATGKTVQVKKIKALTVIWKSYPLHVAVVLYFLGFLSFFSIQSSTTSFRLCEKVSPEYLWYKEVNQNNSKRSNQPGEIWNINLFWESQKLRKCILQVLKEEPEKTNFLKQILLCQIYQLLLKVTSL